MAFSGVPRAAFAPADAAESAIGGCEAQPTEPNANAAAVIANRSGERNVIESSQEIALLILIIKNATDVQFRICRLNDGYSKQISHDVRSSHGVR